MSTSSATSNADPEVTPPVAAALDAQPDGGSAPSAVPVEDARPAAILRGSARGLEIVVVGSAGSDAIAEAVTRRLSEAPGFFRGNDVRIRVEDGPLPAGCLGKLDAIVSELAMRIVEVGKLVASPPPSQASRPAPVPAVEPAVAAGSMPVPATPELDAAPAMPSAPVELAPTPAIDAIPVVDAPSTRTVLGPVRSGVILEHRGNVVIFGDVNPGAEVRAEGNIVVLGRLRGTAHAGIGRDNAFILALRLEPQQLRISRSVARASETDKPSSVPEIAHITGGAITVEHYSGRLPRNLAESI